MSVCGQERPEWWMPSAWPLVWRRAFFWTLPVSGPLWLAAVIACAGLTMALVVLVVFPCGFAVYLKEALWDAD